MAVSSTAKRVLRLPEELDTARIDRHSDFGALLCIFSVTVVAAAADLHRISRSPNAPSGSAPDSEILKNFGDPCSKLALKAIEC